MAIRWTKYEDAEGQWFCPVDGTTGLVHNALRLDADNFLLGFKVGTLFEVQPQDEEGPLQSPKRTAPRSEYLGKIESERRIRAARWPDEEEEPNDG